jgi:protein involved in polysaccharide export with SLBB domain
MVAALLTSRAARAVAIGALLAAGALAISGCAMPSRPIAAAAPVQAVTVDPAAPYRIEAGDQIAVSFPYNPELNVAGPVGPDGRFVMPVVGNLALGGLTIDQSAALIGTALRREGIVEQARPTVAIQQYGAVVYVGGEVRLPGAVKLPGRMDPLQAIISAGGLLDTARSKQVVVLHREPGGAIVQTNVDLRAYAHHGLPTGVTLRSQDIVFVPRSSIAEADLWVDQHINRLLPFSRSLNYSIGNNAVSTVVGG